MSDETKPMTSINQVRQILMNELGLTRESVRELMREIVADAADKYVRSGQLESYLREQIDKALRSYRYGSNELRAMIATSVSEAVKKQIMEKLELQIKGSL